METLKPSQVLRRKIHSISGGKVHCRKCGTFTGGYTESPMFWENGSYIFCTVCNTQTLVLPIYPPSPAFPGGLEIDVSGERKRYPIVAP